MKSLIFSRLLEHFQLTFIAIAIGLLISLPLSVYAYRHRWSYGPISGVAGILYTIPSLALFSFLIPFTGLSVTSAEIGLVSYTLLILIRNVVGGLNSVPADAREAARGMGYSDTQMLFRVEFPIALPVILAGIRLATVTIIGLVTVTALIGYGGLGHFILLGFRQFDTTLSFIGGMLSLLLAVGIDALLVGLERVATPWTRRRSVKAMAT
ncbi:MAG: ABC transporter permease [Actinomycetota bacterium]|nr:ABC transporter permease [Actinomycetota bacterium]